MIKAYLVVIGIMSLFELIAFSYDKVVSQEKDEKKNNTKERFRIPMYVLMLPVALGGAFGALISMFLYRHKTKKMYFRIPIFFASAVQLILLIALLSV